MRFRLAFLVFLFAVAIAARQASATHIRVFMQGSARATATATVRGTPTATPVPYSTPSLPGVIEAELFDATEGVGYHDVDGVNSGGAFRLSEGVDIAATTGGGYHVTSAVAGEWLAYTMFAGSGTMTLQVRVASAGAGGTFHMDLDGINLTGPLAIPDTGGAQSWYTITRTVNVQPQTVPSIVRLVMDSNGPGGFVGSFNYFTFTPVRSTATPTVTPTATPTGIAVRVPSSYTWIPGTFEAEDCEPIHEGTGYFDTDAANLGGAYRPTEGVDIEATSDVGGGYDVGWTKKGEWMEYAWGNVPISGHYVLRIRVASAGPGGVFHLEVGGVDVTGPVTVPDTGGAQSWRTLSQTVALTRGTWLIRLVIDADGPGASAGSFNSFSFDPADDTAPLPPATPTATYTPTPTNTPTPTSTSTPTSTIPPRVSGPTLLSQGKPVLASSTENTNTTAAKAVDGNLGTRWSSAFSDPQWIRVDLGATASINRVVLAWEAAYAKAYQIQVSSDGASWTTLYSRTTGSGGTNDLQVNGTGRYVRMFGTARATSYGYSLWEMKVYGFPLLSQGRPAVASSIESSGTAAAYAVDGHTNTRWSSAFSDPQWITVDLGGASPIARVLLKWEAAYAKAYRVETSLDAVHWTSVFSTTSGDGGTDDLAVSGTGRYVRAYGTSRATGYGYSLWELQVFGLPGMP